LAAAAAFGGAAGASEEGKATLGVPSSDTENCGVAGVVVAPRSEFTRLMVAATG
jgi:hypothetical protein